MKCQGRNLDRISSLHESVRQNIINFLPMEDAIKTSVLSKNWRHVCSSLPILDFSDWHYAYKKRKNPRLSDFRQMVDQTLSLHDESDIHTFSVSIVLGSTKTPVSTRNLNSWTGFAVRHNVKQFYLQPFHTSIGKLPTCLFTCSTLKVLELKNIHLHLPATIAFSLLISLSLDRVKFVDKNLTNKLLSSSSCPVLKVLKMIDCYQDHVDMRTISFARLEHLKLKTDYNDKKVKIKISVPLLHKFEYHGNEPPNLSHATLSSIACASFIISSFPDKNLDRFVNYASTVLFSIGNVKDLTLGDDFLKFLTMDQDFSKCLTSVCHSLKVLHLYMSSTKNQVDAATLLLRKFPNLQTLRLRFFEGGCNSSDLLDMKDYWQFSNASVQDVLKHLKTVEIQLCHKSVNGLDLVRYILETACSLEKMSIKFAEYVGEHVEDRMRLCQKLLTFTGVSPSAAIFFL